MSIFDYRKWVVSTVKPSELKNLSCLDDWIAERLLEKYPSEDCFLVVDGWLTGVCDMCCSVTVIPCSIIRELIDRGGDHEAGG